jgi:glyoxylase-like metal-dependent hydrolase (beta-lactamase superfamily II)
MDRNEKYAGDREFSKRQISGNVWYIKASCGCDTHLVIGSEKAAVIDTGENRRDLRQYIEAITDKPLVVLNTHGHFDHTGANGQFKDCPIHMSAFASENCKSPHNYLDPGDFDVDYTPIPVKSGFSVDLGGGHIIEAIAIPCHSPGSLAWLAVKERLLFTGDEVETGQVLIQGEQRMMSSVERYRDNMLKLRERIGEFDYVCPAHNGTPVHKSIIDDYICAAERVMSGAEGKRDIGSATWLSVDDPRTPEDKKAARNNPMFRRMEHNGASLVYSINRIKYADELPLL